MDDIITINRNIDLVYSPDDGGWYLHEYSHNATYDSRVSKIYTTKEEALTHLRTGDVDWEDWS